MEWTAEWADWLVVEGVESAAAWEAVWEAARAESEAEERAAAAVVARYWRRSRRGRFGRPA